MSKHTFWEVSGIMNSPETFSLCVLRVSPNTRTNQGSLWLGSCAVLWISKLLTVLPAILCVYSVVQHCFGTSHTGFSFRKSKEDSITSSRGYYSSYLTNNLFHRHRKLWVGNVANIFTSQRTLKENLPLTQDLTWPRLWNQVLWMHWLTKFHLHSTFAG